MVTHFFIQHFDGHDCLNNHIEHAHLEKRTSWWFFARHSCKHAQWNCWGNCDCNKVVQKNEEPLYMAIVYCSKTAASKHCGRRYLIDLGVMNMRISLTCQITTPPYQRYLMCGNLLKSTSTEGLVWKGWHWGDVKAEIAVPDRYFSFKNTLLSKSRVHANA